MKAYVVRSLIRAILNMFIVVTVVFVVLRSGPLDPAQFMLGNYATVDSIRTLRQSMGLDKPLHAQYFEFLNRLLRGNLGRSFLVEKTVISMVSEVLPYTLELVIAGVLLGIILGVPPGIFAALRPNSLLDQSIRVLTLAGVSIPIFVIGIVFIVIFSIYLGALPAIGGAEPGDLTKHLQHLILPAFTCGFVNMAGICRLTRASMLDALRKEFVVAARAKGLGESTVICKHALRNALLPLITYLGIYTNILLGSAILVEVIFTRPGIGRLIVEAVRSADFPVAQTVIMFYAGAVVIVNLCVDIAYAIADPRIVDK